MKPFTELVHDALFPSTRIYQDKDGNYAGSSTNITPWLLLIGRVWGILLWLFIILTPLLAPVYYLFAEWFCKKFDKDYMESEPDTWPAEKAKILKNFRNIFWGWIIFIAWGFLCHWGQ